VIVIGDAETVSKCLEARQAGGNDRLAQRIGSSDAAAITVAVDSETSAKVIDLLSERKNENDRLDTSYMTETRFNKNGLERRTLSDFGLIGSIIARLARE
jgi:hypothetical protein